MRSPARILALGSALGAALGSVVVAFAPGYPWRMPPAWAGLAWAFLGALAGLVVAGVVAEKGGRS